MDIELTGKIIGIISALCTGGYFVTVKWARPAYKRRIKINEQREKNVEQMEIVIAELSDGKKLMEAIKKQVMPNGGTSLADSLNRIEDRFREVHDKIDNQQEENRIFNNMQGKAFWESDKAGFTYYVSPTLCKMVERSESELKGLAWVSCLIKSDEQRILQEWRRSIEENRPFDEIYTYKGVEGDIKVHATAFPKKNKNHEYTGSIGELNLII